MIGFDFVNAVALPILFGLFGFVEPCSIGSTLVMVKQIEGRAAAQKVKQTIVFATTRAFLIGLLGMAAALIGSAFLGFQKFAWLLLGVVYLALGLTYLSGKSAMLMRGFGPRLNQLRNTRGAVTLGLLFGMNIPACAAPLILALLASAAAGGANAGSLIAGFLSLALFGLALSLPLIVAVFIAPARRALDRLASLSRRLPRWTGFILLLLGIWSIWFSLFVSIGAPSQG